MNRYTIYCTEAQTKKALKLGAPIELESEYYHPTEHDFKLDNPILCESFTNGYHYAKCPTAEQMLGWLEEQFDLIDVAKTSTICWSFRLLTKNREPVLGFDEENRGYSTRKEATLAAIDAALEYLSKHKDKSSC